MKKVFKLQDTGLFILFLALASTSFYLWIEQVEPFPDRDSVHQLFYPFLNSLKSGHEISANPLFLKSLLQEAYPFGLIMITSALCAVGLGDWIIQHPWTLPSLFIIPFCILPFCLSKKPGIRILIFFGLWFFPTTQIALKSYSFHGIIALIAIPAYALFFHALKKQNPASLSAALLLLFLASTLKHLGAFFFLNLAFAFLMWKILCQESLFKESLVIFLLSFLILLFYPLEGIDVYLKVAFSHSKTLGTLSFGLCVSLAMVLVFLGSITLARRSQRLSLPFLFRTGLLPCSMIIFALGAVITEPPHHLSIPLMILCFLGGYGGIAYLVLRYDFRSVRGCIYLVILLSMVHGSLLYFSFLGQVFAVFFLPLSFALLLFLTEQPSTLQRMIWIGTIFLTSNFSPGVQTLEHYFDDYGHHFYSRGLNGMHQNPLGWQPSGLAKARRKLTQILGGVQFEEQPQTLPMLFRKLHHHTRLQFLYPPSLLHPLPSFQLLKHMDRKFLAELREAASSDGIEGFIEPQTTRLFPIFIEGLGKWSAFPLKTYSCEETLESVGFYDEPEERGRVELFQDVFGMRLNDCLFSFYEERGVLKQQYRSILIPNHSPVIKLWLHRSLVPALKPGDFAHRRIEEIEEQHEFFQELSWLEKLSFLGAPKPVRAAALFKKANDEMERKNWNSAKAFLEQALQLEPGHQEMLIDLEIVNEEISENGLSPH